MVSPVDLREALADPRVRLGVGMATLLATVHRVLGEAVRRENQRGGRIRYVQCIYAPDEQRCLCLFEAAGPELVRSVNDIAQFPLARVMAVLSSVPDDGAT